MSFPCLSLQKHYLYFNSQKKDLETAEKYAESARKMDSYNPAALVNSGVCEMMKEKYDVAKFMFTNALEIDATLSEALYNNGESIDALFICMRLIFNFQDCCTKRLEIMMKR